MNADWTPNEVETLKRLWAEGLTAAKIALQLGRSKNGVVGRAHRMGLPSRPSPIRAPRPKPFAPPPIRARRIPKAKPVEGPSPLAVKPYTPRPSPILGPLVEGIGGRQDLCQWIPGDVEGAKTLYCGQKVKPGSSYCETHHRIATQKKEGVL